MENRDAKCTQIKFKVETYWIKTQQLTFHYQAMSIGRSKTNHLVVTETMFIEWVIATQNHSNRTKENKPKHSFSVSMYWMRCIIISSSRIVIYY